MSSLIGNTTAQDLLKTYLSRAKTDLQVPHFFLVHGPRHVGKYTCALQNARELIGGRDGDLLEVKDYSQALGKSHAIKIEATPESETHDILLKEYQYRDIGAREIVSRLQKSAVSGSKVVLIDGIERMTTEAANSFLKTCEEPLPGRIIIATTGNIAQVLQTIQSRALCIPFFELTKQEMSTFSSNEFLLYMAMGRPGVLKQFEAAFGQDADMESQITELLTILPTKDQIHKKQKILNALTQAGLLENFVDGRIAYAQDRANQA